ncbi:MAG: hypothetical protein FIB07_01335 [Candidatus Methanoperedens sp.]|nr:hypothetical protein [Candidatus Methanoperedens sp.]
MLSELDRKTEAEEHYKQAIAANPSLIEAHGAYGLFLIDSDKRDKAWEETKIASDMFQKAFRYTESYLAKAWFYQRYADKNLERNRYKESSKDINQAGEAYLKASETVEGEIKHALELKGEIKHALELKGNVCKAQSLIRKEHKSNQELVDDLKKASEFYKKASVCPAGGTEETCRACYSVMEVFSQVLMALEEVAHNKNPYLNKNEWNIKLEKSKKIYINIDSKKGVALILALKELIKCVDELAYYTTRKSSPQKKRLKDCYKTLEDVSSKVEGGLRNIIDPANEILRIYSKSKGIPMPEEKALYDSPSPFYEKLFKPIVVAIITIILGYITNLLFEWKTHATIWNFIKSTIINQTLP